MDVSFPCTFVPGNDVSNMLSPVCRHASHQLESGHFWSSASSLVPKLELGRHRFFKSVSVFGFVVGFSKVGSGFGIGFSKYRDIGFGFLFFRTNLPLLIK